MSKSQKFIESFRITWPVLLMLIGGSLWANRQFTLIQLAMESQWYYEDQVDWNDQFRSNNPSIKVPDVATIHRRNHPRPRLFRDWFGLAQPNP